MSRLKTLVLTAMLVMTALPARASGIEALIDDLGKSPEANRQARATLVKAGKEAVPALLQTLGGYATLTDEACVRSARIVRVMKEMGSDAAVPAGADILAFTHGNGQARYLLLNETLDYLYLFFRDVRARDAYVDLVKNRPSQWLSDQKDFVTVFIMQGVAAMAENHDPRVDDVLAVLLEKLPYEPPYSPGEVSGRWTNTAWLGDDGYTPYGCKTVVATYRSRTERGTCCALDPYYRERMLEERARYRIACLQLAKEHGSKRLIPALEPLLKARHRAERDLALLAIEAVNRKDAVSAESYDKIMLYDGDIISGRVQNDEFVVVTPYARLNLNRKDIKRIETDTSGKRRVVELYSGDRLTGTMPDAELKVILKVGGGLAVLKMVEVESVTFARRQ